MTPTKTPLSYDEAIERGRQARAVAFRDALSILRHRFVQRLHKAATA